MPDNSTDNTALAARIDAHQHFWRYNPVRHSWIDDEMAAIRKDFLPADLKPLLEASRITGCVAVQADQTETETDFLLELSAENDFIKGLVGWVDLRAANIADRLAHYARFSSVKGFRHILQGEDPGFMLQADFLRGMALLKNHRFTYDILVFPRHLSAVSLLVKGFPDQAFVIDHLAKPYIKAGLIDQWKKDMTVLARYPNLYCKISGMVTEADMRNWKPADCRPYLDVVTETFGMKRVMYGSDWPVCLAAAPYQDVLNLAAQYFASFTQEEQQAFFGGNASAFYHLT